MHTPLQLFPLISPWPASTYSGSRVALVTGKRVSVSSPPTLSYNFLDWSEMWFARLFCELSTPDCYLIMSLGPSGTITRVWWLKAPSFSGITAFGLLCLHASLHWTPDFPVPGPVFLFTGTATSSWLSNNNDDAKYQKQDCGPYICEAIDLRFYMCCLISFWQPLYMIYIFNKDLQFNLPAVRKTWVWFLV